MSNAYYNCKWCKGKGCLFCDTEKKKDFPQGNAPYKPIFSAKIDNPKDMEALKKVFGYDALNHAFSPEGEGIAEIERNAAMESLQQKFRKMREGTVKK